MSANADLGGCSVARRLRASAALLFLGASPAVAETQLDVPSSRLLQLVQLKAEGHVAAQSAFNIAAIKGIAGQEIAVRVNLPQIREPATPNARQPFILVRNLPAGVRLTTGMANGRIWILPLKDLNRLHLIAQPGVVGSFALEFTLIGIGNEKLAQQSVALDLLSPNIADRVQTTGALAATEARPSEQRSQRSPPRTQGLTSEEERVLLARGRELVQQGGISAARIIFEELAQKGSAQGALALARSYDPAYIPDPRMSAVAADANKALMWYRRAEELGSDEARARLAEIAPGRR
jgi:hypothetical protein